MQPSFSPRLEVATPERVALSLPVAGVGFRAMAYLVDALAIGLFWVFLYFVFSLVVEDVLSFLGDLSWVMQTVLVVGVFLFQWVYWTACEVLLDGQSLGKRLVGIRVIRADGSSVGFFESAVRNLCRAVDFLPGFYAVGVLCMLLDRHHRRLGDLAAGTLLVRAEQASVDKYLDVASATAEGPLSAVTVTAHDVELVLSYLERAPSLQPGPRSTLAAGLLRKLGPELSNDERGRILASPESTERWLRDRVRAGGGGGSLK